MFSKMYEAYVITYPCTPMGISDTLSGRGDLICVVVTTNNIITCMSVIPVISVNIIVIQGLTCVQLHNFAFRQWGTKVLRHFCEMASFSIMDITAPFLCVSPPSPPKPIMYFRPLSLSLDNVDSGVAGGVGGGGYYGVKKECNIKEMKLLIKAHVLNKRFNYFCPWLFLFQFVLFVFTI